MKPKVLRNGIAALALIWVLAGFLPILTDTQNTPTDVVQRELTSLERAERKALYRQLHDDLRAKSSDGLNVAWTKRLEGEMATTFQSFLDLADESGKLEGGLYYHFVFRTESKFEPDRFQEGDAWLTIRVIDGVITTVAYDVLVR
ncbi:hypothetical protein CKO51_12840 [Rhodopirellula sp. SM50]|nr:hypothetical protein [Rhodopirellula sp. SM50]PAY19033.1 hypothetical protein CKO51_12840 [Rhodopirellula sp. SM50]